MKSAQIKYKITLTIYVESMCRCAADCAENLHSENSIGKT